MKLSEKLAILEAETPSSIRPKVRPAAPNATTRRRVRAEVLGAVTPKLGRAAAGDVRAEVLGAVDTALHRTKMDARARRALAAEVASDILGYGPLDEYLADPAVNEIMCNAPDEVWIEREGVIEPTAARFADAEHYRAVIDRIVAGVGRRLDEASPMVDARLPDGSRVNIIIPPLARNAAVLTIRKFRSDPYAVKDLVNLGTMSLELALFLEACVRGKQNVLIAGGTGSGKTTMLNVLSNFVPAAERVITVEDVMELQLAQPHVVSLEYRPPNAEGRGEVTIRDLVRNALRMRPDRIVVGEVRGGEALDMLQAMNTGHDGSLTTLHASSARDALSRLETMVLMAGFDLPVRAIREQIVSALDVLVYQERTREGARRVTEVCEIHGMEGETIVLQKLFTFDHGRGRLAATGLRPHVLGELTDRGIELPPPWGGPR